MPTIGLSIAGPSKPRERWRRFLLDYTRDASTLRAFIDECQHSPDEQHRRALQDLVVLIGRPLGFDVTFGAYAPAPDAITGRPYWRSRTGFHAVLDIRVRIVGRKVFLSGTIATDARRGIVTDVVAAHLPEHEIHNEIAVADCPEASPTAIPMRFSGREITSHKSPPNS